jgi:hypothetical protein
MYDEAILKTNYIHITQGWRWTDRRTQEINFTLWLITEHYVMQAYGGVEVCYLCSTWTCVVGIKLRSL